MSSIKVKRFIQRQDPFRASEKADSLGKEIARADPERAEFFSEREVLNRDGSFPFGEGFLYQDDGRRARAASWNAGRGQPGKLSEAGHRGSKPEQQDAFRGVRLKVGGDDAAVLVAADGVSASGPLASRASRTAVEVFLSELRTAMKNVPENEAQRHPAIERAMSRAAFIANFEVIRQVLFDRDGSGRYDYGDRQTLRREMGVDLPAGKLSVREMQMIAPQLDQVIQDMEGQDKSALTTFAAAIAVGNDLYTFATGDAVIALYRPEEPEGKRVIHLTHRDQVVVELYRDQVELDGREDVYENVITDALGDSGELAGTLRRYPNLLEPGDRVIACSDGLSPRGEGRGVDRPTLEEQLESAAGNPARALVRAQLEGLEPDEYQDNIGVVVLEVD